MSEERKIKPGGLDYAKAILEAQKPIRSGVGIIANDTISSMKGKMRGFGFYDTGITEASFKRRFGSKEGILNRISFVAQRNAFVLANVGRDYRWQTVNGRREIIKNQEATDFIFPFIDLAKEKIADVVANKYADISMENLTPIKK